VTGMAVEAKIKKMHVLAHAAPALLLAALMEEVWQRHSAAIILGSAGACVLLCGLCAPKWYCCWNWLVQKVITVMVRCVTWALLRVVYFGVVTPIGIVRRVLGHDALGLRFPSEAATFWHTHEEGDGRDSYRRPY